MRPFVTGAHGVPTVQAQRLRLPPTIWAPIGSAGAWTRHRNAGSLHTFAGIRPRTRSTVAFHSDSLSSEKFDADGIGACSVDHPHRERTNSCSTVTSE